MSDALNSDNAFVACAFQLSSIRQRTHRTCHIRCLLFLSSILRTPKQFNMHDKCIVAFWPLIRL